MNDIDKLFAKFKKYLTEPNKFRFQSSISTEHNVDIVEEIKTNKLLAKKTYNLSDDDVIKYFYREIELLIKVKIDGFPFIKIFAFYANQYEESFILTEYINNKTLGDLIKMKNNIENYDTILMKILYHITFGLNYLHKNNIVHRDIKPDNIFLDKNFNPYIGDFGLSRIIKKEDIVMTGNTGSLFYMAPEIIYEDRISSDQKDLLSVDSYSLAVTVLQALTGSLTIMKEGEPLSINNISLEDEDFFIDYVQDGNRYKEIDELPENLSAFKKFILDCWDDQVEKRWPIDRILSSMRNKKLYLPNCNDDEFTKCVQQLDRAYKTSLRPKSKKYYRPSVKRIDE